MNRLEVIRETEIGLVLNGVNLGEILLPARYVKNDPKPGDMLNVFLMLDSEDRLIATSLKPLGMVNEFAFLKAVSITEIGAFLDWGLPKDLFVPFREQKLPMQEGQSYMVRIYFDEVSGRIAASAKLDRYLDQTPPRYKMDEKVNLQICSKTDLGYKAIINGAHWGMIFYNEVFQPLARGQKLDGYIKEVRYDGNIDLCLQKYEANKVVNLADTILEYIKANGGFMPITDKNPPEDIYRIFSVSKKNYKRAIGALYKRRLITIEKDGTKLV